MHLDRGSVFERNGKHLAFLSLALKDESTRTILDVADCDGHNNTPMGYANLIIDFDFIGFDEGHDYCMKP